MSSVPTRREAGQATDYRVSSIGTCVRDFIADAKKRYKISIVVNQEKRDPSQAQQFHVCHMFLLNFFKKLTPKHVEPGTRTISWTALSEASLSWDLIADRTDFLRTAGGQRARLRIVNGTASWDPDFSPDEVQTRKAMAQFLKQHHVSSMAAPGKNGCGYPCECGGLASSHIRGAACDLGGLKDLDVTLRQGGGTSSLDAYLAEFNLHRPLAHYNDKRKEEWHVEKLHRRSASGAALIKTTHSTATYPLAKHAGKDGQPLPGLAGVSSPLLQNAILKTEGLAGFQKR